MQAILCVVVTVFATGVVCDYAPCEHAPAVKNTPHGGSQLDVSIGRAPSQPAIRSRSSGGQDIDFWHLCG